MERRLLLILVLALVTGCDDGWSDADKFEQMSTCMRSFREGGYDGGSSAQVQQTCECWINAGIEAGLPPDTEPDQATNLKWDVLADDCIARHLGPDP